MSIAVNVRFFGGSSRDSRKILIEEDSRNLRVLLKLLAKEKATSYIEDGCVVTINNKLIADDVELMDKDEIRIMPMLHGG
jgi:molybdopterin converting factor small subunit